MGNSNKKYIKTFDALRVVALLGVFLYHLMPNYVPSGYLGVVIFFVLAGFLTMKNTMWGSHSSPVQDEGSHSSPVQKIIDKIWKLYPALLLTVLLVTICMCCFFRNFLVQYPVDALSSIFSVNNYAQIFRNESYFEAMNSLKPLTHIWALSLEFQFYVVFFLLVFPFYKESNSKKYLSIFFILTIISLAISIYLVKNGANLTRIYYSLDSRLATFLMGVMSAVVADGFSDLLKKAPGFVKLLEIILIIMMIYAMIINFNTDAQVIGIIIVYSVLLGVLLLLLYTDNILMNENDQDKKGETFTKIINVIVKRSYVIYLVHYPIITFANRILAHANVNMKMYFAIVILVTIIVAEIVYRLSQLLFVNNKNKKLSIILSVLMAIIIILSSIAIKYLNGDVPKSVDKNDTTWLTDATEKSKSTDSNVEIFEYESKEILIDNSDLIIASSSDLLSEKTADGIYDSNGRLLMTRDEYNSYKVQTVFSRIRSVNALVGGDATLTNEEFLEYRNMKISFIGDSVTQGSRGSLSVYFPNAVINAEGNRQLRKALPIFYDMKEKGELGDVVVVALGTNSDSDIRVDVLEEIYENLDDRMMIILTVAIPYLVQEQQRNAAIRKFADTHDNCHLADWYSTMKTHKEYFVGDDTHPQGLGTDVYAQLIFKTAIESLEWRKIGNEWQYFGSGDKMKFAVELNKEVGETVKFGNYYINSDSVKEPIEWIILNKNEETKTELLMSKYALNRMKYNDVYIDTPWQKSKIRKWLNSEFYSDAFENVGSKFIETSALDNHKNPEYKTMEMGTVYDRVFCPSYDELKKYVSEENLKCKGTNYFKSIGGYVNDDGYADWWTRTAGDSGSHVMNVSADGKIIMAGDYVTTDDFGIRPLIKVTYK